MSRQIVFLHYLRTTGFGIAEKNVSCQVTTPVKFAKNSPKLKSCCIFFTQIRHVRISSFPWISSSIRNKKEADGPSNFLSCSLRHLDSSIHRAYLWFCDLIYERTCIGRMSSMGIPWCALRHHKQHCVSEHFRGISSNKISCISLSLVCLISILCL